MKVLEIGEEVEWKREIECPHCKTKLAINADDILYTRRYEPTKSDCPVYYTRCSACNGPDIHLADCFGVIITDIPAHIRLHAKNRYFKAQNIQAEKERAAERRFVFFGALVISVILLVVFYANYIAK